jgi:cell division protease FtsH
MEKKDYSEATAEIIDSEVQKIVSGEYERALAILKEAGEALKEGAKLLLEKEKIEGSELKAVLEAGKRVQ